MASPVRSTAWLPDNEAMAGSEFMKYEYPQIPRESRTHLADSETPKRKPLYRSKIRLFTAECERCSELLAKYISAANAIIDIRQSHLRDTVPASEIKEIQKLREDARKSLLTHKRRAH